jgi:hypothetical protein
MLTWYDAVNNLKEGKCNVLDESNLDVFLRQFTSIIDWHDR